MRVIPTDGLKSVLDHMHVKSHQEVDMGMTSDGIHDSKKWTTQELEEIAHLLYFASQGNIEGIKGLIEGGVNVDSADYDGRTALHLAASEGKVDVARYLLSLGADVNPKDRWGSTPSDDALHYGFVEVREVLEAAGGELSGSRNHTIARESPFRRAEFELDRSEFNFESSRLLGKGDFGEIRVVSWRGTPVAVKTMKSSMSPSHNAEAEFRAELSILQTLRHPNIVQFLGAITETEPRMLVTEYYKKGDLQDIIKNQGPLPARKAVGYSLDIARGMSYLHQHSPDPIVHRDLKPSNLLQDDAGHLKVADFGFSHLLKKKSERLQEASNSSGGKSSYCYMAPELYRHEAYDKSVDVFAFAFVVYEMFEGMSAPVDDPKKLAEKVAVDNFRPPFTVTTYPPHMKELISSCWDGNPEKRPDFLAIVEKLEKILADLKPEKGLPGNDSENGENKVSGQGCQCNIL